MDIVPQIVLQNPFRILGVFANAAKKDVIANKAKAIAFLKVNRAIAYPLDLETILPKVVRTIETLNIAESHLSIAKEQIKYAQFWFMKLTSLDDIAFNYLFADDISGAKKIWSKHDSVSSLQNKSVCYIIEGKPWLAVKTAEKLYSRFGDDYISRLDANCALKMTSLDLLHQFIDTLAEEIGIQRLLDYDFSVDVKSYILQKAVSSIIKLITAEIETSQQIDHNDSEARRRTGQRLIDNTKDALNKLRQILTNRDSQYQLIADKLGIEILQCAVDYFNHSELRTTAHSAMLMTRYADSVVVGTLTKQRCEDNIERLQEIIDQLPPDSVEIYDTYIQKKLTSYNQYIVNEIISAAYKIEYSTEFLLQCIPYFESIKESVGKHNAYYRKVTTHVIGTLLNVTIDNVNQVLGAFSKPNPFFKGYVSYEDVNKVIGEAFRLMRVMMECDMDDDFRKNRLSPNVETIIGLAGSVGTINIEEPKIEKRSDRKLYLSCETIENCNYYLRTFPNGKYRDDVEKKKEKLRFEACETSDDCDSLLRDYPHKKNEIEKIRERILFESCLTTADCDNLLRNYPNRKDEIERLRENILFNECTTYRGCKYYLSMFPSGAHREQVEKKLDDFYKSQLDSCKTGVQLQNYIQSYPESPYLREAQERKLSLERSLKRQKLLRIIGYTIVVCLIVLLIAGSVWYTEIKSKQRNELAKQAEEDFFAEIENKGDTLLCLEFIKKYPKSRYRQRVSQIYEEYEYRHLSSLDDCLEFIKKYRLGKHQEAVQGLIKEKVAAIEKDLLSRTSEEDVDELMGFVYKYQNSEDASLRLAASNVKARAYQIEKEQLEKEEKQRQDDIKKAEEQKARDEYAKYGTDGNAWKTATSTNTIEAYQEYLSRYPRGRYKETANKRIIDLEVQKVVNSGKYGSLPSSQKVSNGTGRNSTVNITSRCHQTITIMYSGVKSIKVTLSPYQSKKVVLPSGTYKVVATSRGVIPFYGNEQLTGGIYESEYYIETRYR